MGRQIMIVGNGEIGEGHASRIDAADLVMRFNDCRSFGPGGRRTDIVALCNTGRPARKMLDEPGWKEHPAVMETQTLWCVRDPALYAAMRQPLAASHPELDDFCDDYSGEFTTFARQNGKSIHIVPAKTHKLLQEELDGLGGRHGVCPSTGLIALAEFLSRDRKSGDAVMLFGFGHLGWEWHPWEAERKWVDRRVADGILTRQNDNKQDNS